MARIPRAILRAAQINRREYEALEGAARAALDRQWDAAVAELSRELATASAFRATQIRFIALALTAARESSDTALRRVLQAGLQAASAQGAAHASAELSAWLEHFGLEARPVDVRAAAQAANGLAMDRYRASAEAWGRSNVEAVRRAVTGGILARGDRGELVDGLVNALSTERWRARRIVRTELSSAYHGAHLQTLRDARDRHGLPVRKTCILVRDNRTARDSLPMQGQVRELDEMFTDGAGRQFLTPPGRPNDREKQVAYFGAA